MRMHAVLGVLFVLLISLATLGRSEWRMSSSLAHEWIQHPIVEPIKMAPNCPSGCYKKQRSA